MKINQDYIIGAATALMLSAFGVFFVTTLPATLSRPPVTYEITKSDLAVGLCPNQTMNFTVRTRVDQPGVVELATVFADPVTGQNLPDLFPEVFVRQRLFAWKTDFEQDLVWKVPDFGPGSYVRLTAATSKFSDAEPFIVQIPFTIKEGCNDE